jgi:hypothetical protein
MSNDQEQPEQGEAGMPQEQTDEVADPSVALTPEDLDQREASMTTDRKPGAPLDEPDTAVAEDETPSDMPPTSIA